MKIEIKYPEEDISSYRLHLDYGNNHGSWSFKTLDEAKRYYDMLDIIKNSLAQDNKTILNKILSCKKVKIETSKKGDKKYILLSEVEKILNGDKK